MIDNNMADRIKVFCIPFAGGSAAIYNTWKGLAPATMEIVPVELAGRGRRMTDPLYKDIHAVVADVLSIIQPHITSEKYMLFGHSMGGLISYLLAREIAKRGWPQPLHLFVSGKGTPHINRPDRKKYHKMPYPEFKEEVLKLGGTPEGFFDSPELMELFLPLLISDFTLAETAFDEQIIHPVDCDITLLIGSQEDLTAEQIEGWRDYTKGDFNVYTFEGGHFFIHDHKPAIIQLLCSCL
jgi:medium-chain acyl-[acyl-carrier-protein] hydrolase